jgi:hypothetical protein
MDNLRSGGALRWKVETVCWEDRGVVCGKSAPSRIYAPPVSVKDRWAGPREQVLNISIAYRWYGSGKPSSLPSTYVWLSPLLLWLRVREKLDGDPQISQPMCWGYSREFLFLGSSDSVQLCRWLVKGCYALTVWDTYGRGPYTDWAWDACWSGFPCMVYIDSNHRDSRIWVTACLMTVFT